MKILHTGDIHLDSPFANVSAAEAEIAKKELRNTFSQMMKYARDNYIDLILLTGDVFDCGFATRETASLLMEEFEAAECPIIISPGNHDPYTDDSIWKKREFPDNVYIFNKPELNYFDFDELGARVYGFGFTDSSMINCPIDGKCVENTGKINILCAHGDLLDSLSKKCPLSVASLKAFGADYSALGHVHNIAAANAALDAKGISAAYCGCPQGRDFGETGIKGAFIVDIDANGVRREFVPFSEKVYETAEVNLEAAESVSDIASEVRSAIARGGYTKNTLLRVYLRGFAASDLVILASDIAADCKGELCYLEIIDETVPSLSGEELMYDKGIRGEVYRMLLPKIESGNSAERSEAVRALRYALAALAGQPLM